MAQLFGQWFLKRDNEYSFFSFSHINKSHYFLHICAYQVTCIEKGVLVSSHGVLWFSFSLLLKCDPEYSRILAPGSLLELGLERKLP